MAVRKILQFECVKITKNLKNCWRSYCQKQIMKRKLCKNIYEPKLYQPIFKKI